MNQTGKYTLSIIGNMETVATGLRIGYNGLRSLDGGIATLLLVIQRGVEPVRVIELPLVCVQTDKECKQLAHQRLVSLSTTPSWPDSPFLRIGLGVEDQYAWILFEEVTAAEATIRVDTKEPEKDPEQEDDPMLDSPPVQLVYDKE